ncbi:MAG: phosphate transporter substrate-binding protein PhoT family [Oscillospiraceae bacterium]|nr:phosphate transporter substrate-binding protein PhoT family [Oscillospiraceae bacterium]
MRKLISAALISAMALTALAGCGASSSNSSAAPAPSVAPSSSQASFDTTKSIAVISREEGSGTRGAFIELIGIEQKNAEGKKIDNTTEEATITNSTSVMMTSVAGNPYGIGYISLGSLNDTVKALKINGAEATAENIKLGSYKVARPFNIVTKGDISEVAQDFMGFILSTDGQAVVEKNGYISVDAVSYNSKKPSGKVVVAGSSSVTPVMEKLKEAYAAVNPNATIEVQQSDSTTGVNSAIEGICDIGMASRELKDSELEKGAKPTVIAIDGIAVIVNNNNTVDALSTEQVLAIYTGEATSWNEVA